MRIKRVEIIGFKSFCDRAVVQLGAEHSTITGIVGPNGCGKSNIVDAIRWCMGEQSAKHLRGKAMEDVIFAGSETRGPAPMAEVSITLDDVGFSHEALELARTSDEAGAEQALDSLVPEPDEDGAAAAAAETADAGAASAESVGTWVDEDGNRIASPQEEVSKVLADPATLDFGHYTEVTITRRLYRDGLSQYFINKTPCRLRDITDFFLGTGVGTKAYAIIEQGRIGQIVSSRPQDRRLIIEEAAGITKFKAKKKAAEKKLDQTRQNLMRVSDIVAELDKRMGTLRRQAQKAERYRKYKAELRDIELCKSAHRWLELAGEGQLVTSRLTAATDEREHARTAWATHDARVVSERAELAIEERRLVGVQDQVHELDNQLRLGESRIGFEQREAEELDGRVAAGSAEVEQIAEERARGAAELEARTAELATLEADVAREAAEVVSREAAAGEAKQMVANAQGRLDEARGELGRRRTEIATADTQLEALGRRREEASRRLERVTGETEQHAGRARELEREGKRVDGALVGLRQTRLDLGTQNQDFEARREALTEEVARGEAEVEELRGELARRTSRLTSLVEIQARYEGLARGTRAVMERAGELGGAGDIRGVIADVVRAPETLEIAVEAALGDRLGGVLVAAPEVGLAAIDFLKQGGGGRSAFVSVEAAGAAPVVEAAVVAEGSGPARGDVAEARFEGEGNASFDPSWIGGVDAEVDTGADTGADTDGASAAPGVAPAPERGGVLPGGVLGAMADLVAFAEGYDEVGRRLLGSTIVVEDLAGAIRLHRGGVAARLVTLAGDVVDRDGVVAGGSRDAQGAGVLAQKREIRELEERVATLEHQLADATARLTSARAELKQIVKAIEGLRAQVHEGEIAILGHEKDEARIRADLERLRDRLGHLGSEQLELEERLRAIETDEQATRERRAAADARIGELERVQLDLIAEVSEHRDRLDDLAQVLTEARVRAAQLGEKRAAAEAATLRLARADADLAARAERLAGEIEEAGRRAAALREGCDELPAELAAVRERRATELHVLDEGRAAYQTRVEALTEVELAARELRQRADELATEVGQLELRDGQIRMHRQHVIDHVAERYQIALASILHDYHLRPTVTEAEEERLRELRELIDRMGTDINLTAIDEFAEVSTRFEFLSAQKIDLERAVDQLARAIDKINKTSRKLFRDTFDAVNAKFKEVFPRLFRGGQAALSLTGSDKGAPAAEGEGGAAAPAKPFDLLEAGIEIMAQPPGKKNATVEQLSGGEKALTAVALVFSIFLIKPSPFCILDEVDAPLDEANVDRYNQIVREMTDRSQFIVITHNKRTMESADNLYGVTMQEPGVSKLVSVNLSRIGARKPDAPAAQAAAAPA